MCIFPTCRHNLHSLHILLASFPTIPLTVMTISKYARYHNHFKYQQLHYIYLTHTILETFSLVLKSAENLLQILPRIFPASCSNVLFSTWDMTQAEQSYKPAAFFCYCSIPKIKDHATTAEGNIHGQCLEQGHLVWYWTHRNLVVWRQYDWHELSIQVRFKNNRFNSEVFTEFWNNK